MQKVKLKNSSGFSIVEVIVATTIISITIFALMSTAQKGTSLSTRALQQSQANTLLEEGVEVVKSIRDEDWTTISGLSLGIDYYLFFNTTTNIWSLNVSSLTPGDSIPDYPIDSIFNRTLLISAVNRDASDDISELGTLDPNTKKVSVTVSFLSSGVEKSKTLSFYIMDIFN